MAAYQERSGASRCPRHHFDLGLKSQCDQRRAPQVLQIRISSNNSIRIDPLPLREVVVEPVLAFRHEERQAIIESVRRRENGQRFRRRGELESLLCLRFDPPRLAPEADRSRRGLASERCPRQSHRRGIRTAQDEKVARRTGRTARPRSERSLRRELLEEVVAPLAVLHPGPLVSRIAQHPAGLQSNNPRDAMPRLVVLARRHLVPVLVEIGRLDRQLAAGRELVVRQHHFDRERLERRLVERAGAVAEGLPPVVGFDRVLVMPRSDVVEDDFAGPQVRFRTGPRARARIALQRRVRPNQTD